MDSELAQTLIFVLIFVLWTYIAGTALFLWVENRRRKGGSGTFTVYEYEGPRSGEGVVEYITHPMARGGCGGSGIVATYRVQGYGGPTASGSETPPDPSPRANP